MGLLRFAVYMRKLSASRRFFEELHAVKSERDFLDFVLAYIFILKKAD